MTPEDWITVLLPLVWAGFLGLPLVGITVSEGKQEVFEKISDCYLKFVLFFTIGSFVFLIANDQWISLMSFLMNGQMWIIHLAVPSLFWVIAGYYFYTIWRDTVKGAKAKKKDEVKK